METIEASSLIRLSSDAFTLILDYVDAQDLFHLYATGDKVIAHVLHRNTRRFSFSYDYKWLMKYPSTFISQFSSLVELSLISKLHPKRLCTVITGLKVPYFPPTLRSLTLGCPNALLAFFPSLSPNTLGDMLDMNTYLPLLEKLELTTCAHLKVKFEPSKLPRSLTHLSYLNEPINAQAHEIGLYPRGLLHWSVKISFKGFPLTSTIFDFPPSLTWLRLSTNTLLPLKQLPSTLKTLAIDFQSVNSLGSANFSLPCPSLAELQIMYLQFTPEYAKAFLVPSITRLKWISFSVDSTALQYLPLNLKEVSMIWTVFDLPHPGIPVLPSPHTKALDFEADILPESYWGKIPAWLDKLSLDPHAEEDMETPYVSGEEEEAEEEDWTDGSEAIDELIDGAILDVDELEMQDSAYEDDGTRMDVDNGVDMVMNDENEEDDEGDDFGASMDADDNNTDVSTHVPRSKHALLLEHYSEQLRVLHLQNFSYQPFDSILPNLTILNFTDISRARQEAIGSEWMQFCPSLKRLSSELDLHLPSLLSAPFVLDELNIAIDIDCYALNPILGDIESGKWILNWAAAPSTARLIELSIRFEVLFERHYRDFRNSNFSREPPSSLRNFNFPAFSSALVRHLPGSLQNLNLERNHQPDELDWLGLICPPSSIFGLLPRNLKMLKVIPLASEHPNFSISDFKSLPSKLRKLDIGATRNATRQYDLNSGSLNLTRFGLPIPADASIFTALEHGIVDYIPSTLAFLRMPNVKSYENNMSYYAKKLIFLEEFGTNAVYSHGSRVVPCPLPPETLLL